MKNSKEILEMHEFSEILDFVMTSLCLTDEDCSRLLDLSTGL